MMLWVTCSSLCADEYEDNSITLNLGILYDIRGHRALFQEVAASFMAQNPNIKIQIWGHSDVSYKKSFADWLAPESKMDVLYWQGGQRLLQYAKAKQLHSLTSLWQQHQLIDKFPTVIQDVVKDNGDFYAIPFSYYGWGIMYNQRVLDKLETPIPRTWPQLLAMCKAAKKRNVTALMVGSRSLWFPAAWFDYLNLRINGLDFHLQLLQGKESFLDQRVTNVLTHWKQLIDADCFNENHRSLEWRNVLTPLYRQLASATLIGNFIIIDMPKQFLADMTFRQFPDVVQGFPRFENMPVDVFVIPQASQHKEAAEKLLTFLASASVQQKISHALEQSTPHLLAQQPNTKFVKKNEYILKQASGLSQYFDRDMPPLMVEPSLHILVNFLDNANINATQQALEQIRLNYINTVQKSP